MRVHPARTGARADGDRRRARLSRHLPRRYPAPTGSVVRSARGACASARRARRASRPPAGHARPRSRARRRRLRRQARRRPVRLPARGRRRRCGSGHHRRRPRCGPAGIDATPDLSAAAARLSDAVLPARSDRRQRRRSRNFPSRRARRRCRTRRCRRCLPPGGFWISHCRREAARPRRWPNSGRGRSSRGTRRRLPPVPMLPAAGQPERGRPRPRIIDGFPAVRRAAVAAAPSTRRPSMTTIVAVRKNDEIAIAADSLTTFGDTRLSAQYDTTSDKIVHYKGTYLGLCGSAAHQLVFQNLLAKHADLDFSTKSGDLRDVSQAASDSQGAALPQSQGRGGRSVRIHADHRAGRQRARHLRRLFDARSVRVHAVLGGGFGPRVRAGRDARAVRAAARPPRRSRRRASRRARPSTGIRGCR